MKHNISTRTTLDITFKSNMTHYFIESIKLTLITDLFSIIQLWLCCLIIFLIDEVCQVSQAHDFLSNYLWFTCRWNVIKPELMFCIWGITITYSLLIAKKQSFGPICASVKICKLLDPVHIRIWVGERKWFGCKTSTTTIKVARYLEVRLQI